MMAIMVALAPHLSWQQRAIALSKESSRACGVISFVLREVNAEGGTMWSSHARQRVHDAGEASVRALHRRTGPGCKAVGDCPLTGITRNPWDLSKNPGGSSAGADG